MNNDRLSLGRTYINRARAKGEADADIWQRLLEMGWTVDEIVELSEYLETPLEPPADTRRAMPPPPPPPPPSEREPMGAQRPAQPAPPPPPPPEPEEPSERAGGPEQPPEPAPERKRVGPPCDTRQIELTIGAAWLTRIGVVAVLLAAVVLFKRAWEQQIIEPWMLFVAGLIVGAALMVVSEFTHRSGYRVQSQALTGGGAALLYLTLWAGPMLQVSLGAQAQFPAMALVTVAAAVQAIRHESETIATLAWITGYAVPLLIGLDELPGAGVLFGYLALLSVAVFVVGQRHAWPTFTGLALLGAYSSGAYMHKASGGSLGWTLTYLMLVTAGMLWVSTARKGREGESFGSIGTVAGYLVIGVVLFATSHDPAHGDPMVPYMYLLALSGSALALGHMQDRLTLRWLGAIGSFVGFLLMLPFLTAAGLDSHWMLLYAAMSVGGIMAVSGRARQDAEPLALSAMGTAYAAAAILTWHSTAPVVGLPMFIYLTLLAGGTILLTVLFDWRTFSLLSISAAFLATGLLYGFTVTSTQDSLVLVYIALLAPAALAASVHREDRAIAFVSVIGTYLALPLTGAMQASAGAEITPIYLALATIATLSAIEWGRWYGFEWASLLGTWGLYLVWRGAVQPGAGDHHVALAALFLLAFVAAAWVRHGVRGEGAGLGDAALACANATAFASFALYDLWPDRDAAGMVGLGLTALYATAGIMAIKRRPGLTCFGPVHVSIGVVFLTGAIPLLAEGYHMTMFWTAEVVLLMLLGLQLRAPAVRTGALLVLGLPLIRAVVVDSQLDRETYHVIANPHALTMLALISALYMCAALYVTYRDRLLNSERNNATQMFAVATALLLWLSSAEAWFFVRWQLGLDLWAQQFALSGVWVIFGAALLLVAASERIPAMRSCAMVLFGMTVAKVLLIDPRLTQDAYVPLLHHRVLPLIAIAAALYAVATWYPVAVPARDPGRRGEMPVTLAATALLLWILSWETFLLFDWYLQAPNWVPQFAVSWVWVLFGGALLLIGAARHYVVLRWCALVLLAATVAKVFIAYPMLSTADHIPLTNPVAPMLAIVALAFIAAPWYRRSEQTHESERGIGTALVLIATALLLWISSSETWLLVGWHLGQPETVQSFALSGVWVVFGAILLAIGATRGDVVLRWGGLGLLGLTALKVYTVDMADAWESYVPIINSHAAPLLAIAAIAFVAAAWYRRQERLHETEADVGTALIAIATALLLWVFSTEAWYLFGQTLNMSAAAQYAALSTVWLTFAAAFLAIGTLLDVTAWRWAALGLFGATTIKVLTLDYPVMDEGTYTPILNPHALPLIVVAVALFAAAAWYNRSGAAPETNPAPDLTLILAALGLLVWVASTESWLYLGWERHAARAAQDMALSMVWLVVGGILFGLGVGRDSPGLRVGGMVVLVLVAGKVLLVDRGPDPVAYALLLNYFALPLLLIAPMLMLAGGWYRHNGEGVTEEERLVGTLAPYAGVVLLWWVFTVEALHYTDWALNRGAEGQKYVLSIVWALYGGALAAVGLWRQNPALRWMAMGLLGVTIIKVFTIDLSGSWYYRVLALLVLGVVLIVVGFAYQRLVRDHRPPGPGAQKAQAHR